MNTRDPQYKYVQFPCKITREDLPMPANVKMKTPLWKGPYEDGITSSLLSRFLVCRERFRVLVMDGIKPVDAFNHRIEFGNMFHLCQEAYSVGCMSMDDIRRHLNIYCRDLSNRYPSSQSEIVHWGNVCNLQFPHYIKWDKEHRPENYRSLLQEEIFSVPYRLPSNRVVNLRGKWDGISLGNVSDDGIGEIWLDELKTKGEVDEESLIRQLRFDLQTMIYLVAVNTSGPHQYRWDELLPHDWDIAGVNYTVVRRPLSGGTNSIRQRKDETLPEFYARLAMLIESNPDFFFYRWQVTITQKDIQTFRDQCLDPILEQLCDWWDYMSGCYEKGVNFWDNDVSIHTSPWGIIPQHPSAVHWRYPYGVYNPLLEGGMSDVDGYMESGSMLGLEKCDDLFPELKGRK